MTDTVTFVAVGDVDTYTAKLLTTDGEILIIQVAQPAAKLSILEVLRGAGTKSGGGFNMFRDRLCICMCQVKIDFIDQ